MLERIGAREAKRRMDEDGWIYLDVRSVPEFEQGHPNGAYNVPLLHLASGGMATNEGFVAAVIRVFDPATKIVVGCQSGVRSVRAAELLLEAGFQSIAEQRAGFGGARGPFGERVEAGWLDEGLPTSTEAATGRSWAELGG
ncbi:MAG: rhodanese-like domain-containing protein [Myxococcales bacterium]|nr:rhodanese-like domain-containing protein [Myxococcales bacterium]